MSKESEAKRGGFLGWVERAGNKIPSPFGLFLWLCAIVLALSLVLGLAGVSVTDPATQAPVSVMNLVSWEGLYLLSYNFVTNFQNVAVVSIVLVIGLVTALCERTGLFSTFIKLGLGKRKGGFLLVFIVALVAELMPTLTADAAFIIVPPLIATVFLGMKRHPLAGLFLGYASVCGGISKAMITPGMFMILNPVATQVMQAVAPGYSLNVMSNFTFMLVASILWSLAAAFVTIKIIEPRLGKYIPIDGIDNDATVEVTDIERKAAKNTVIALILGIAVFVIVYGVFLKAYLATWNATVLPEVGGTPRMVSMVISFIVIMMFVLAGVVYGVSVGKIKKLDDAVNFMGEGAKLFAPFIVLMVAVAQFLFFFDKSNLGKVLAIAGGTALKNANASPLVVGIIFVIVTALINIFMGSGTSKWLVLAPIFVPMFYTMGINPAYTTALYALGDNVTNNITPLLPYIAILVTVGQKYDKKVGMGTIISMQLPYSIGFLAMAILQVIVWYALKLPLGIGGTIFVQ